MIAALVGVGVLFGGSGEQSRPDERLPVDVELVAKRVERIRGLRFDELPRVRTVTAEQAREEGLGELDRSYSPRRRRADEQLLTLLGLLPPQRSDLRELAGSIFGEQVAGYYDERSGRLALVVDAYESNRVLGETILAHELTHALEDQRFGLEPGGAAVDDAELANLALVEGTATIAMIDYGIEHLGGAGLGSASRRDLLAELDFAETLGGGTGLPPYLDHTLLFPYFEGARFVDAVGTWRGADRALRGQRPVSTEQILHPRKYRRGERPLPVGLPSPGAGWRHLSAGTFGEFDTAELIRSSDTLPRSRRAAAGWGGGRYRLWERRGGLPDSVPCPAPCRRRAALVAAWRWDTPRDAAEFAATLPRYIRRTLRARPSGAGSWSTRDRAAVAVGIGRDGSVRLALAPSRALALRLSRGSVRGARSAGRGRRSRGR